MACRGKDEWGRNVLPNSNVVEGSPEVAVHEACGFHNCWKKPIGLLKDNVLLPSLPDFLGGIGGGSHPLEAAADSLSRPQRNVRREWLRRSKPLRRRRSKTPLPHSPFPRQAISIKRPCHISRGSHYALITTTCSWSSLNRRPTGTNADSSPCITVRLEVFFRPQLSALTRDCSLFPL